MPKKRKYNENAVTSPCTSELPKTFRELTQLSNTELNSLLRMLDLPVKQKRNHKLTTIAQQLNITTIGEDNDQDPFLQTLADIKELKVGWTSDIRKVPDINIESIKNYLLAAHDIATPDNSIENYTVSNLKTYRATRAFDLWESRHLSGFLFNELQDIDGYCAVKCLANPSGDTSGTQYNVIVVFKDSGGPIGASCTCVAGLGEACTHIAGLMFGVEDFVSRGYKELPDGPSTTDILCKWSVPRGPAVAPTKLSNVKVKKNVPGKESREKAFSAATYNPLPEDKRRLDFERLTELHHTLSIVNPNLPWVKAVAPAIVAEHKPVAYTHPICKGASHLPDMVSENDFFIVPAKCCEVKTNKNPPTLADKIKVQNNEKITRDSVKYSAEEGRRIEEATKEQSSSSNWFKYRKGLITASKFQQVDSHLNVMQKKGVTSTTETLVESFVKGCKFKGNSATKYGQKQEPRAVEVYQKHQSTMHTNLQVEKSGLVISAKYPFLGASPDRLVSCDCHGKRLLEVKCPYTLVDKTRSIESLDFLHIVGDSITLKQSGNSYFAQIQGQMGVTGVTQCDLVVFDGKRIVIVQVPFDENYWNTLSIKLDQFHQDYVFPALVTSARGKKCDVLLERRNVQNVLSEVTNMFPCGKCGHLLSNQVMSNHDASIQCECSCGCKQWYHWRCVNYVPDPDNFDEEPAWYCAPCVRNCDIIM